MFCRFFIGFVFAYYYYSYFIAGFLPVNYALIWLALTIASPFLAFITWYAKGKGLIAILISAGIIGVLINTTFYFGDFYIDLHSYLSLLMLLLGIWALRRSVKEMIIMLGISVVLAIVIELVIPINFI